MRPFWHLVAGAREVILPEHQTDNSSQSVTSTAPILCFLRHVKLPHLLPLRWNVLVSRCLRANSRFVSNCPRFLTCSSFLEILTTRLFSGWGGVGECAVCRRRPWKLFTRYLVQLLVEGQAGGFVSQWWTKVSAKCMPECWRCGRVCCEDVWNAWRSVGHALLLGTWRRPGMTRFAMKYVDWK